MTSGGDTIMLRQGRSIGAESGYTAFIGLRRERRLAVGD
jgi:hypothetical protein